MTAARAFGLSLLVLVACLFAASVSAETPVPVVQVGHSSKVPAVAWSPDGTILATGSWDFTVKLWDVATGKEFQTLEWTDRIESLAFSPDGKWLAAGAQRTILVWDAKTGVPGPSIKGFFGTVNDLAFSPDGSVLALATYGDVRLYRFPGGPELRVLPAHPDVVIASVAFSPDGRLLATVGWDKTIKLWNTTTWALVQTLSGHTEVIHKARFSPDGRRLASASSDRTVRIWDVPAGTSLATLTGHPSIKVSAVAWSPDGQLLASTDGGEDRRKPIVMLWDAATYQEVARLSGHDNAYLDTVVFSPDGRLLASGASDGTVKLWRPGPGAALRTLGPRAPLLRTVAFAPNGTTLVSGGDDHLLHVWDLAGARQVRTLKGHTSRVNAVAVSPDGRHVASGAESLRLWELDTGREIARLDKHTSFVSAVAWSPDGTVLASGGYDNRIRLWNAQGGLLREIVVDPTRGQYEAHPVNALAFSPDGRSLLSGSGHGSLVPNTIQIWDVASGRKVRDLPNTNERVYAVAWSPDGRRVATGGFGKIKIWNPASGALVTTLSGRTAEVHKLAYSPDGRTLASANQVRTVTLWDVATGTERHTLTGHTFDVHAIAWSPDGRRIASAGRDATLRLWDAATAKPLAILVSVGAADAIALTEDGYYTGSKGAFPAVAFRLGREVFLFEQFDLRLNRPDIVIERIGLGTPEQVAALRAAWQKRLRRMQVTEAALDSFERPALALTTTPPPTTADRTLTVSIEAEDDKAPLQWLLVSINEVSVLRLPLRGAAEKKDVTLALGAGLNRVELAVQNARGVESLRRSFEIVATAPAPPPDLYVLAVGVSRYADVRYPLRYAGRDAEDVADLLQRGNRAFGRVHTLVVKDGDATRERILAARTFLARAGVDDHVVVFFAGHGLLDDKLDYWFATVDVDFDDPASRGLAWEALEGLLDGLAARKKLLLVDTCHSGEVDRENPGAIVPPDRALADGTVTARGFPLPRARSGGAAPAAGVAAADVLGALFADLRRGTGASVISASAAVEYALESSRWRNGVFTFALREALEAGRADTDRDNRVTVAELRAFVIDRVYALTEGRQRPTSRRESLEFDFQVR